VGAEGGYIESSQLQGNEPNIKLREEVLEVPMKILNFLMKSRNNPKPFWKPFGIVFLEG
jgi:hypothetical protein